MVYAKFGGQTECIMGNWKIVNKFNPKKDTPLKRTLSMAPSESLLTGIDCMPICVYNS